MQTWKTLSRRTVLDRGRFLTVENHTVQLPDGQVIDDWSWIITPDYINVLAVTQAEEFLCFRQTKYAVDGTTLAPVGGYLEPNEDPLGAAQRELLEETGYKADDWTYLGGYAVDGNRGVGTAHLFLARAAHREAEPNADDLEEQELLLFSRSTLEAALKTGEFKVLPWAALIALALCYMRRD
jgi:ADP-ribose pyrophosphatase